MRGSYEGIGGSALVGMFYCCTGSDGTIRGCPDQPKRYDEGGLGGGSFEEIWRGWFRRYRGRRVVCEDGRCVVFDERGDCVGGCWVTREYSMHCVRDYVGGVEKLC
ncbi:MAG: hypothetical protein GQ533_05945 [Methanosarcinaceae archaeon]|nr:hypothetical protein [Methanosarcinaceae archaeon]